MDFKRLAEQYKTELLDGVLPFWLEKSQDREFGGYFTCLDRDGSVYDTDKFIWLQGREVWMFAMLYNKVERRPEWLECAVQGAEFLRKYGHDGNYNWYFALTREGRPLVQPYNIFSYTFAAMAFAQVAVATGSDEYAMIAKRTFDRILEKRANPKGEWCKAYPGTRSLKSFALPMILCNMALEIEPMIDKQLLADTIGECLHEVMEVFYREELGLIVENVIPPPGNGRAEPLQSCSVLSQSSPMRNYAASRLRASVACRSCFQSNTHDDRACASYIPASKTRNTP